MAHKKNKWPGKTGKSISWEQFEKWKEQGKKLEPNVVFDPVFGRPDPFRGKYDKKKASKKVYGKGKPSDQPRTVSEGIQEHVPQFSKFK